MAAVELVCAQADGTGRPVFAFSSLSSHTPDLRADPRASLTVTARGYQVALQCLQSPDTSCQCTQAGRNTGAMLIHQASSALTRTVFAVSARLLRGWVGSAFEVCKQGC